MSKTQFAYLAGGCFWCTEAMFRSLKGVTNVTSGYVQGAETVKIEFDPKVISYPVLLDIFFHVHDPTSLNRQGNDVGLEYRSAIFYVEKKQRQMAEAAKQQLTDSKDFVSPLVTEIVPLEKFSFAEDYHQDYFEKNPANLYCQLVISPKLKHLRDKYSAKLK